jgi:hypothetical protein
MTKLHPLCHCCGILHLQHHEVLPREGSDGIAGLVSHTGISAFGSECQRLADTIPGNDRDR